MRNVYPVFFTKTNDNVLVEVPDLDILTEGKDMNDAIMAYVKICYSVQSTRMGMLDEALGNCIKFIQHIRNK